MADERSLQEPSGKQNRILRVLLDRRMLICVATGFVSLPLFVVMQLMPAWLRLEGVSLTAIGFFTAVQYPLCAEIPLGACCRALPFDKVGATTQLDAPYPGRAHFF